MNKILSLIAIGLLTGCSSNRILSFDALDAILSPTETSFEERTPLWYADQDMIRPAVLDACLTHFHNKAEDLGGSYLVKFQQNLYSLYPEIPDCDKARQGDVIALEKSGARIYQHQVEKLESEISDPKVQAEIHKLAEEVANRLEKAQDEENLNNTEILKELNKIE